MLIKRTVFNHNIPAQSYIQILSGAERSSDSSNKPWAEVFADDERVSFGLTGLNQLGPKCRECVFVQLDSLNITFGLFVCLTEWWSHKWRVRQRWQVRKHPKHTHTYTSAYRHIIRRSRDSGALSRRAFMSILCIRAETAGNWLCVYVWASGWYLVLGFLQIAAGPQREPQTMSDLGLVLPTAQLLR